MRQASLRITENNLAAIAAAAIKQRMIVRRSAREFCPFAPSSKRAILGIAASIVGSIKSSRSLFGKTEIFTVRLWTYLLSQLHMERYIVEGV